MGLGTGSPMPTNFPRSGRRSTQPPAWWPEGEPWPGKGTNPLPRSHSLRRRLLIFVGFIFLLFVAAAIIVNHGSWDAPPWREPTDARDGPPAGFWWPPVALFIVGTLIFVVVRKITRTFAPLEGVMDAAGRVAEGDYTVRVASGGPADVQGVVEAFNTMTERLGSNDEQRRRLLSDIAHELRTPLAVVQGTIEGMIDDVYPRDAPHLAPLLDQTRTIARLLDDLQTLATTEAGMLPLHQSMTELGEMLRDVAASFAPAAARTGVNLAVDSTAEVSLEIDPVRIRQVLDNLVTNALRYTPEGGAIALGLTAVEGHAEITVHDTGRGLPADEASRMFERFVKSADSGGSGLGLAIAKGLVEAHGGAIGAESAPGEGTTVTIRLPNSGRAD
jgi:signal transduction histidine kinase